jgi:hypothetical protein
MRWNGGHSPSGQQTVNLDASKTTGARVIEVTDQPA